MAPTCFEPFTLNNFIKIVYLAIFWLLCLPYMKTTYIFVPTGHIFMILLLIILKY